MTIAYQAVPTTEISSIAPDPQKLASLSLLAIGIYIYLLWNGSKNIEQLAKTSPATPYAAISNALDELIETYLVKCEEVGEVTT